MRPTLRRPLAIACLGLGLVLAGCKTKTSDRDLQPVTPPEAIAKFGLPGSADDARTVWIDPRTALKYAEAHIPGAVSIPFGGGDFEFEAARVSKGRTAVVIYGDNYQDILADAASKRLIQLGYKDVFTLRGGIEQWVAGDFHRRNGRDLELTFEVAQHGSVERAV